MQGDDDGPSFVAIDPLRVARFSATLEAADLARLSATGDGPLLWLALVTASTHAGDRQPARAARVNPSSMRGIKSSPKAPIRPVSSAATAV